MNNCITHIVHTCIFRILCIRAYSAYSAYVHIPHTLHTCIFRILCILAYSAYVHIPHILYLDTVHNCIFYFNLHCITVFSNTKDQNMQNMQNMRYAMFKMMHISSVHKIGFIHYPREHSDSVT
jgi:hypothetical protein